MTHEGDKDIEKTWHTEDLDFDEYGRLVIKNKSLQKAFLNKILGESKIPIALRDSSGGELNDDDAEIRGTLRLHGSSSMNRVAEYYKERDIVAMNLHCIPLGPNCPIHPWPDGGGCNEIRPDMQMRIIHKVED